MMLWVTNYGKEYARNLSRTTHTKSPIIREISSSGAIIDISEMTDTDLQRAIGHVERIIEVGDGSEINEWRLEGLRAEQRRRAVSILEAQVQSLLKRVSDLEAALKSRGE